MESHVTVKCQAHTHQQVSCNKGVSLFPNSRTHVRLPILVLPAGSTTVIHSPPPTIRTISKPKLPSTRVRHIPYPVSPHRSNLLQTIRINTPLLLSCVQICNHHLGFPIVDVKRGRIARENAD